MVILIFFLPGNGDGDTCGDDWIDLKFSDLRALLTDKLPVMEFGILFGLGEEKEQKRICWKEGAIAGKKKHKTIALRK